MLHRLHRAAACIVGVYVALHLCNHLWALQSVDAHIRFMEALRHIYRNRLVEALLLSCIAFQIGSGVVFIKNRWRQRRGFFEHMQALSGGYLAFFLLVHVTAVMFGRAILRLDTNFYFAAAGMHVPPFHYFFVPYYFLAVVAIFGHIACAVHWLTCKKLTKTMRNYFAYAALVIGVAVSALIVAAFAGVYYGIEIPPEYRATYGH